MTTCKIDGLFVFPVNLNGRWKPLTELNKSIPGLLTVKLTEFVMKTAKELSAGEREADIV
jgi:hypothetical protein